MKKEKKKNIIKPAPKNLMNALNKFVKENGTAKTAVALGYKETSAIKNWIKRNDIPVAKRKEVKLLKGLDVIVQAISK